MLAFTPARGRARDREGAALGGRERRGQPRPRRRRAGRLGRVRRRGPDAEALARPRARPRRPDPASGPATSRSSCAELERAPEPRSERRRPEDDRDRGREGRGAEEEGRAEAQAGRRTEEDRGGGVARWARRSIPAACASASSTTGSRTGTRGTKEFPAYLLEDIKIREHINGKLAHAGLSDILIRKDKQRITIDIYTARPGIVIGKSGVEVDALRKEIHGDDATRTSTSTSTRSSGPSSTRSSSRSRSPSSSQNRVSFRRAMKRSLASAMRSGAHGVKVQCGGRLGGGEMSRSESYSEGRVPLHTIRADIDYGFAEAKTTFGRIGVKVWINKGEIMPEGYEGVTQKDSRLGDQDQARRRGGTSEGLGASREGGRGRRPDREGLGPVRQRRGGGRRPRRPGGRGGRAGGGRGRACAGAPSRRRLRRSRRDDDRAAGRARAAGRDAGSRGARRRDAGRRRRRDAERSDGGDDRANAAPEEDQVPQVPARPPARHRRRGRPTVAGRRLRPEGARGRLDDEPPDRGRPDRDDAQDQARRQGLDQHLPGQAGDAEAGRDAHGLRQGLARALGRRRQARPRDVRARRRPRAARQGGAAPRRHASCRSRRRS